MLVERLITSLRTLCGQFSDKRTGDNVSYSMADLGMTAFSIFFMQSPSFLANQRLLESARGLSNCQTLFGMSKIPTDNHVRNMLDGVEPSSLFSLFYQSVNMIEEHNDLKDFRRLDDRVLIALDGSEYHCSKTIHCEKCQRRKRKNGQVEHYHSMLCATMVTPFHNRVLPLEPEFITTQDGHDKQDCEAAAIKRWLDSFSQQYQHLNPVYLGDDLASRQPICEAVLAKDSSFIFTAKPKSHKRMFEWIEGAEISTCDRRVKKGRNVSTYTYRWLHDVPLRSGSDALRVNWFALEITDKSGKSKYKNTFITNLNINENNIIELVDCARARWKIENGQFNIIKNHGYHLEHNFGHGKQNLAALLVTMNLLAFAFHTICDLIDRDWQQARDKVGPRKEFFNNFIVLTRYLVFTDWKTLIKTIIDGEPPPEICS